jgi:hypothetical protein
MGLCASANSVREIEAVATDHTSGPKAMESPVEVEPPRRSSEASVLAKYTISSEKLGRGATSDVYKGTRCADGKAVAVKVLDKHTSDYGRRENLAEDIVGARTEAELMKEVR